MVCTIYALKAHIGHPDPYRRQQHWQHFASEAERDITAKAFGDEGQTVWTQEFKVELTAQAIARLLDKFRAD